MFFRIPTKSFSKVPMQRLKKFAEHLVPTVAKDILFTPLHDLILKKDLVFKIPFSKVDVEKFDWCTWPDRDWYCTVDSTVVRVLVVRLFWLQYFVAMGPVKIRYWSYLLMDQHIPLILWCEKHKRAPSYMECVTEKLLPTTITPLCEETLCMTQYGLQDLLQQDGKTDFFKVKYAARIWCISRTVWFHTYFFAT